MPSSAVRVRAVPWGTARTLCFGLLLSACPLFPTAFASKGPAASGAAADEAWELRVCADADNLPYSNAAGEGFENRAARIIADELGAKLVFVWMPENRQNSDAQLMLRYGECDVVPSVMDGQESVLTTNSYYTSASQFVTLASSELHPESLDDPILPELRIGVDRSSPVDFALLSRVDVANLRHYQLNDPADAILQDLLNGELDVAIVRGAVASYFKTEGDLPIKATPVTPEVDIPFLALTQPMAMGVRSGDEALRDLLNRAMQDRGNDIGSMLEEFGLASAITMAGADQRTSEQATDELRVGVVLPVMTGPSPLFRDNVEPTATAVLRGVRLAAELSGKDGPVSIRLLLAAAPNALVAERSAERMIKADGAVAIIGGVGENQATTLAGLAAQLETPFFNVADPDPALRSDDLAAYTYNVAPGAWDYSAVIASLLAESVNPQAFLVVGDTEAQANAAAALQHCLDAGLGGDWLVGHVEAPRDLPFYGSIFEQIQASGATTVVLILEPDEELVFSAQYGNDVSRAAPLLSLPMPGAQLRRYYWALLRDVPTENLQPRLAMWDSSVELGDFNSSYLARWGEQPDAVAWAGYEAVSVLQQMSEQLRAAGEAQIDQLGLLSLLSDEDTTFELEQGHHASFSRSGHQFESPVYQVVLHTPPSEEAFALAQLAKVVDTAYGRAACAP